MLFSPLYRPHLRAVTGSRTDTSRPAIRVADAVRLVSLYHPGIDLTHHRLTLDVAGGPDAAADPDPGRRGRDAAGRRAALAADIQAAGGRCELQIWPHQVHVFQALPRMTPEAAKAMAYVARFIAHALQDARALADEVG